MLIPLPSETAVITDSVLPSSNATRNFWEWKLFFSSKRSISSLVPEVSSRFTNGKVKIVI